MYKLSIDIGTTSVKAVLFADKLNVVAKSSKEYSSHFTNGIYVEQSPQTWWNLTCSCVRSVLKSSGIKNYDINAVGVSAQAPSLIALDEKGEPLFNSLIWLDRRAEKEAFEIRQNLGEEVLSKIGGKRMDSYHLPPKILWFKRNYPELFSKTKSFVQCAGYINYKLTGELSCDKSSAALSFAYDIGRNTWSEPIIKACEAQLNQFPPIFECEDVVGRVNLIASEECGLAVGTPVIAGCVDASAASVEAGELPKGTAFYATGTASTLRVSFDKIIFSSYLSSGVGFKKTSGSLFGEMSGTGSSMKWIRDLFNSIGFEELDYKTLDLLVESKAPSPSKVIFLPYLAGERSPIWNQEARGIFWGMDMTTNAAQLIRAVMEGTAFALKDNIEAMKKSGVTINVLRSVGGCTNSNIWLKIIASVTNCRIEIPKVNIGAPAGMAMLCAKCTGEFDSVEEFQNNCVKIQKTILPETEWINQYEKMFILYKEIYEKNRELFSALNNFK